MERFRDGDKGAFRILFKKYQTRIIGFCFLYCNDRDIAEELAQEVFMRVYKAVPKYRADAKFSTWIFHIATNVCLNELRKIRYRYSTESLDSSPDSDERQLTTEIAESNRHDPHNILEDQERNNLVLKAISSLPKKQRIAVLLRTYHRFSYREIGKQMSCSEASVKSLIHRGRQNLKKILQKNPGFFDFSGYR